MRRAPIPAIAGLMLTALAAPAGAVEREGPPEHFFNQAGATPAELNLELRRCRAIGTAPQPSVEGPQFDLAPGSPARTETLDDCMVARGWRIYALSPAEQRALARRSRAARTAVLRQLIGASRPGWGRMVREDRRLLLRAPVPTTPRQR